MTVINLLAAFAALELVVVNIGGTYTNGGLEVPVLGEHPLVAVADAATDEPALEAVVAKLLPPAQRHLDVLGVLLYTKGIDSNERAVETVAEPVAVFGIDHPVLDILLEETQKCTDYSERCSQTASMLKAVMSTAAELPLYQLKTITVYNTEVIDETTIPLDADLQGCRFIIPELRPVEK